MRLIKQQLSDTHRQALPSTWKTWTCLRPGCKKPRKLPLFKYPKKETHNHGNASECMDQNMIKMQKNHVEPNTHTAFSENTGHRAATYRTHRPERMTCNLSLLTMCKPFRLVKAIPMLSPIDTLCHKLYHGTRCQRAWSHFCAERLGQETHTMSGSAASMGKGFTGLHTRIAGCVNMKLLLWRSVWL